MNKGTTYDIPPSYPVFDMKSSVTVNKNNLTTQAAQVNQTLSTPTPIVIQLPNQFYPNTTNTTNTNLELSPNSRNLPSISEFFNYLDQDRKSTRLNSSHVSISYAVFCLKKKKKIINKSRIHKDTKTKRKHFQSYPPETHARRGHLNTLIKYSHSGSRCRSRHSH